MCGALFSLLLHLPPSSSRDGFVSTASSADRILLLLHFDCHHEVCRLFLFASCRLGLLSPSGRCQDEHALPKCHDVPVDDGRARTRGLFHVSRRKLPLLPSYLVGSRRYKISPTALLACFLPLSLLSYHPPYEQTNLQIDPRRKNPDEKPPTNPVRMPVIDSDNGQMDVISRLLKDRILLLGQGVDDEVANVLVAQLLYLANEDPEKDITLYINSPVRARPFSISSSSWRRHLFLWGGASFRRHAIGSGTHTLSIRFRLCMKSTGWIRLGWYGDLRHDAIRSLRRVYGMVGAQEWEGSMRVSGPGVDFSTCFACMVGTSRSRALVSPLLSLLGCKRATHP